MLIYHPKPIVQGTTVLRSRQWALIRTLLSTTPSHYLEGRGRRMPPKKKEVEGPGPLLGRFGTSLKCGIVGLPNVG